MKTNYIGGLIVYIVLLCGIFSLFGDFNFSKFYRGDYKSESINSYENFILKNLIQLKLSIFKSLNYSDENLQFLFNQKCRDFITIITQGKVTNLTDYILQVRDNSSMFNITIIQPLDEHVVSSSILRFNISSPLVSYFDYYHRHNLSIKKKKHYSISVYYNLTLNDENLHFPNQISNSSITNNTTINPYFNYTISVKDYKMPVS
jgi:hypothetical protein